MMLIDQESQWFLWLRAFGSALLLCLALACSSRSGAPAVDVPAVPQATFQDPNSYAAHGSAALTTPNEGSAVSRHSISLNGGTLAYTATAGHLTAVHPQNGSAEASFFYVAYTLDGAVPATRPVTFFYNGGPGSASVWLHLGSFGPKRLVTGTPDPNPPTPFPLVDNQETLLGATDLVFVDAVSTGHSQAIAPYTNSSFWGVDADAAIFRDFITRYVALNHRQTSQKFLFGESYGTTRTAVLAHMMESAGMRLSGIVLLSSVLNYNANADMLDASGYGGFFPSYASSGAYWNLTRPVPADDAALGAFLQSVRTFTATRYAPALDAFLNHGAAPDATLFPQLSSNTGLPESSWNANFNLDAWTFRTTLRPGVLLGRYDARVSAPVGSPLAQGGDPSSSVITVPFASALSQYLRVTLGYSAGSSYTISSNAIQGWNFHHDGLDLPDVIPDLGTALALNPSLQVLSLNGYHDLATPFYQTELDLARLSLQPTVEIAVYHGGHMIYLNDASRPRITADLLSFYQRAATAR